MLTLQKCNILYNIICPSKPLMLLVCLLYLPDWTNGANVELHETVSIHLLLSEPAS